MIRGFDSPIVPIRWYYPDGSACPTEHEVISVRDDEGDIIGLKCESTGLEIHSMVAEVKRLQDLVLRHVYIAESIFSGESAWKGRTRHGVCLTLEDALDSLSTFADEGKPLLATPRGEPGDTEFWDEDGPIRWMVHRSDEAANWGGVLWIFKERVWNR